MRTSPWALVVLCIGSVIACGNADIGHGNGGGDSGPDAGVIPTSDPLDGLPTGVEQWTLLCAKGYGDMISAKFCAGSTPPALGSLLDLQTLLGLTVAPNPNRDPNINKNVRVAFAAVSTALGLRQVSPLNPRALMMTPFNANNTPNPTYQVMAFARGETFVELVANDPGANTLRFFLLRFNLPCQTTTPGCNHADLLTSTIESGWTGYTIYDDAAIVNTTLDCMNCHQPAGPGTTKMLRMQEFANPWMHWFYEERPSNKLLLDAFHAVHTIDYANVPSVNVDAAGPAVLQRLLSNNGFAAQPNAFDTTKIQNETALGQSTTWDALYAKSVAGTEIPTPYFAAPHSDAKIAAMTSAYQQVIAGTLPRDQLPDISDTLQDSVLADMSIRPKPGLDGRGIMTHMCTMCHNSKLDQTLTRAKFNVANYAAMSRLEKDEAIHRIQLADGDAKKMPPARFHVLSDAERDLVIQELSK